MMNKQYAVIKTGSFLVENTIAAPLGFEVKGCYLIEIGEGKTTQPGAFYNPNDGFFMEMTITKPISETSE